jgi:hypothetical protein
MAKGSGRASPSATQAIPATQDTLIITCDYSDHIQLYDNHVLGWVVDTTSPLVDLPVPILAAGLPEVSDNGPQWGTYRSNQVIVPNPMWRGTLEEFLDRLTQKGMEVTATFVDPGLNSAWETWATNHPDEVFTPDP